MLKEIKKVARTSTLESLKFVSAGIYTGLTVGILQGQKMINIYNINSIIILIFLFLIAWVGLTGVCIFANIGEKEKVHKERKYINYRKKTPQKMP